mmetsp:Transcript_21423/g.48499  ORF Transcript_21423/g.48499 Transcript_21423/m.48499 type:complete len:250 (+) Transcript_21423:1721-2470(+)
MSSCTWRGWKRNSSVTSSLGLRKPSVGSTLKSGANRSDAHRHLVPMSPTFSSCTLRVVLLLATTAPKKSMSVSSFSSTPTAEPLMTMTVLRRPPTSSRRSSANGSMRCWGLKERSISVTSLGLSEKSEGWRVIPNSSKRAADWAMEQRAKTGEKFLSLTRFSVVVPTLMAPSARLNCPGLSSDTSHSCPDPVTSTSTLYSPLTLNSMTSRYSRRSRGMKTMRISSMAPGERLVGGASSSRCGLLSKLTS